MSALERVILTTGGTGGHIFPALAVAEELRVRHPDVSILFIGGRYGQEAKLAGEAGLEFYGLPVRGFLGRGFKAVGAGFRLIGAIMKARGRIRAFKPDLVMGFGGYAAAPAMIAGRLSGCRVLLHEQNSIPGAANRLIGRFAHRICISLPDAAAWFDKDKIILTGNPVRSGIRALYGKKVGAVYESEAGAGPETKTGRNLLVLGGSQGARAVNNAVLEDLPALAEKGFNIRIQCGESDLARVTEAAEKYPAERVEVTAFIKEMDKAYAWADLALCRAGASTVAELAAAGLPALFIPFPQATHDHQSHNAKQAEKLGAAVVVEQKNLSAGKIAALVSELLGSPGRLEAMSRAALGLAKPEAASALVDEAEQLTNKR